MSLQHVKTYKIPLFHVGIEEYKCATLEKVTLLFMDWGTSKTEYSNQLLSRGHKKQVSYKTE